MTDTYDTPIHKTKIVYLDNDKYIRVFFDNYTFHDVLAVNYERWKQATGNFETNNTREIK
jgi:hypothetical protein